jgi:hypothetical protein
MEAEKTKLKKCFKCIIFRAKKESNESSIEN